MKCYVIGVSAVLKGGNGDIKRTQLYDKTEAEIKAVTVDEKAVEGVTDEKKDTKASLVESAKTVPKTAASKTK